jgi:hypothetical protein
MTRTAPGEYDTADRFHTTRSFRFRFLHRAAALEPDLQPSLAEAIEAVPVATFEMPEYRSNGGADAWSQAFEEHLAQFERIRTAIAPWQDRWHLTDEWIAGEVYLALVLVRRPLPATARVGASWTYFDREPGGPFSPIYPPTGGVPGTTAFLHSLAKPLAPLFVFSARWYPQYESRAEISRWLRKQFEQDLTAYLDACETTMEAAGLVRAPKKYPRLRGDARQHLDWLVRFQVQEWSQTRIAQHYERGNAKTVADALRKTATLIGLTRRSL